MELACVNIRGTNGNSDYCEFVPIIRGHTYTRNNDLQQKLDNNQAYRFRLGKVWSTPLHGPFNNQEKNIVAHQDDDEDVVHNFNNGNPMNPTGIYRNIEVELSPSFLPGM